MRSSSSINRSTISNYSKAKGLLIHRTQYSSTPSNSTTEHLTTDHRMNFYSNSQILRYSQMESAPFSLRQLMFFGKILGHHRSNVDDLERNLVAGANFTRVQLPIRLARQIREFQSLPYIVTSNHYLIEAYKLYVEAFEKIRTYPQIQCRSDNQKWCAFLQDLLNQHKIVIPKLAIGIAETAKHLTNSQIEQFMTRMLHSRISRRVLAEHHIALTQQFQNYRPDSTTNKSLRHLGVIDTELEVGGVIERCIQLAQSTLDSQDHLTSSTNPQRPIVHVSGEKNAKFAYIADHLEFIVFELLLNALRTTIHTATQRSIDTSSLPIKVQIASSSTHISVRISDQAGGILPSSWIPSWCSDDDDSFPPSVSKREMFSFVNLTTANDSLKRLIGSADGMEGKVREQINLQSSDPSPSPSSNPNPSIANRSSQGSKEIQEARLRIGLPLSSIYAQFLGGSLEIYSIPGSADVVLCIPKLGTITEPC